MSRFQLVASQNTVLSKSLLVAWRIVVCDDVAMINSARFILAFVLGFIISQTLNLLGQSHGASNCVGGTVLPKTSVHTGGHPRKKVPDTPRLDQEGLSFSQPLDKSAECYLDQQVPTFIIAGAQKAGTSALYYVLENLKPQIVPSPFFETHFFDQRGKLGRDPVLVRANHTRICEARQKYQSFFNLSFFPDAIHFEKTPAYLCRPDVPSHIKTISPNTKVIVMLRDPVDRALSHFKMTWERTKNESKLPPLELFLDQQVEHLRSRGLSNAPTISEFHNKFQSANESELDSAAALFQLSSRSSRLRDYPVLMTKTLMRGVYHEQLRIWLEHFTLNDDLLILQYEAFLKDKGSYLNRILRFVGAPTPHGLSDQVLEHKYTPKRYTQWRTFEMVHPLTRKYLELFYQPYNEKIESVLGRSWQGVWQDKEK